MQAIAAQNNLSETAFLVGGDGRYQIRWFTPESEVPLCGHATLAAAFVINRFLQPGQPVLHFNSMSGGLGVEIEDGLIVLDLPADPAEPALPPQNLVVGLGLEPLEVSVAEYYMALFDSEEQVRGLRPRMDLLATLDRKGVIVTAPGDCVDFVSRFFAPALGIAEDPVTGAAHCTLVPFWASRLEKPRMHARQLSRRGGDLICEDAGDRVRLGGRATLYLEGSIYC
jgi:PhzF family phenazine biosynthesis protein